MVKEKAKEIESELRQSGIRSIHRITADEYTSGWKFMNGR